MAGYRSWTDADRLTAADLNGYLMGQCVPRFANAADRDAQMGGVVPGQQSYLIDPGVGQIVSPAGLWVNLIPAAVAAVIPVAGLATLVAGTAVVTTTAVTPTSRIRLTAQSLGTVTAPSALAVSARTPGTSFTILASQDTDTSAVAWLIDPA